MKGPFPPIPCAILEPLLHLPSPFSAAYHLSFSAPGIEGGGLEGRGLSRLFHSPGIQRVLFCPLSKPWDPNNLVTRFGY